MTEGDTGDDLYIIKSGKVSASQAGIEIRIMEQGSFFGEQALMYGVRRTANITALTNVTCLAIGREELREVLGAQLPEIIYKNIMVIAMESDPVLTKLTTT